MKLDPLKWIVWIALLLVPLSLGSCDKQSKRVKHIIQFGGEKWLFPSTIGEAVQRNKLSFRSPAFYYKMWGKARQVTLSFDWISGDFDSDLQKQEALYDRNVNTYTFRIKRTDDTYDSLKHIIESTYHKKFQLVKGNRTTNSRLIDEKVRPFQHYLLKVDNELTIGIKNSYSYEIGDIVTVHFLYGLSLGDIGNQVGNY